MAIRHYIVVCMPKSGSTFLTRAIEKYTGVKERKLRTHHEIHEIDRIIYTRNNLRSYVSQIHLMPSTYSVERLNKGNFKVILLYRNIYGSIASMFDYYQGTEYARAIEKNTYTNNWGCVVDQEFLAQDSVKQLDRILAFDVPQYCRFFVGWKRFQNLLRHPPLWIQYESFFSDQEARFAEVLNFLGEPIDAEKIRRTFSTLQNTRMNRGFDGSAHYVEKQMERVGMTQSQQARLLQLIECYPDELGELLSL